MQLPVPERPFHSATCFGAGHVLGGQCLISVTLNERGEIVHLNETPNLPFGERDGARSARVQAIASALSSGNFQSRLSEAILEEMWEKWIFIATNAGITCLMRAAVGDIVAGGAADRAIRLLDECTTIATQQGFPPSSRFIELNRAVFTTAGSGLTASMLRDIERGAPIEADHIVGNLLRRGDENASPLVRLAYAHLKAYEARRGREMTLSGKAA